MVVDTPIDTVWANPSFSDFEAEFSDSLSRSGKGGMTAALKLVAGTISAPAWSFSSETNTGVYRNAAGDIRFSVLGVDIARWSATYGFQMYVAASWVSPTTTANSRELLTANRTYYVRTDGSDSNTGLTDSAGGGFLTIQKAVDVVTDTLDFAGYQVVIRVKDGTYTGAVVIYPVTGCDSADDYILRGNVATPASCVISTTSANAISIEQEGAAISIEGFKLQTTTTGDCLKIAYDTLCQLTDLMTFGTSADGHINAFGGTLWVKASYTIAGNADYHYQQDARSTILFASGKTITLTGTPAFAVQFAYCGQNSTLEMYGAPTFSGSATGTRYYAEMCGTIFTYGAGASYLPGNAGGSTATGGQYG